jgi:hypothetical protein
MAKRIMAPELVTSTNRTMRTVVAVRGTTAVEINFV